MVPGAAYDVQVIHDACDETDESEYSTPLTVTTAKWCDIVTSLQCPYPLAPEGTVNITDALAVIDKYVSAPCSAMKARAEVEPESLDMVLDIADILHVIDAFGGQPYPFSAPQAC